MVLHFILSKKIKLKKVSVVFPQPEERKVAVAKQFVWDILSLDFAQKEGGATFITVKNSISICDPYKEKISILSIYKPNQEESQGNKEELNLTDSSPDFLEESSFQDSTKEEE